MYSSELQIYSTLLHARARKIVVGACIVRATMARREGTHKFMYIHTSIAFSYISHIHTCIFSYMSIGDSFIDIFLILARTPGIYI